MIPMSDFQFGVYEEARVEERKIERNNAKKRARQGKGGGSEVYEDSVATYRIFSRAFCNFVFPREGGLRRPLPNDGSKISGNSSKYAIRILYPLDQFFLEIHHHHHYTSHSQRNHY